jgi:hypothetical protein
VFYLATSGGQLRACPSRDCPVVAVLQKNEEVVLIENSDMESDYKELSRTYSGKTERIRVITFYWLLVRVKRDGRLGYVGSQYLTSEPTP